MSDDEYLLKICLIGSSFELKETLLSTFRGWKRSSDQIAAEKTVGVSITTKRFQVNEEIIKIILVNTIGHEFFGKVRPSYYRGASAAIIVFDKGDKESFTVVEDRFYEFRSHIPDTSIPITLVGIISESEEVTAEQAQVLAENLGIQYVETSLDDQENVELIFSSLMKAVLEQKSSEV